MINTSCLKYGTGVFEIQICKLLFFIEIADFFIGSPVCVQIRVFLIMVFICAAGHLTAAPHKEQHQKSGGCKCNS